MKHQPVKQGQTTTPRISFPTLSDKCVGSLTSPANHITLKMQETGPTVYSRYPMGYTPTFLSVKISAYHVQTCERESRIHYDSTLHTSSK